MREKVSTAYFLDDPRKFSSMEEAEKELNRLRAVCVRLKKKQGEDIAFMLGLSVTDSQYMGKMGYQKSMRYGGKKVFICSERRIHNGERVEPCTDKPPHIHIMVGRTVKKSAAFIIVDVVPDIRQPLPSGVVLQKDFLVLYAVALAAVPVLVPYGKAGVKGCDFVVIIHVHILLCVHVGVLYT